MNFADQVRAREDEVLVAAFQVGAAEILGREIAVLNGGSHGAVENENALSKLVDEPIMPRCAECHRFRYIS